MLDNTQVERLEAEAVNSAKVRQPLYAARKKVFPKRASGSFRQFKWLVMAITLGIYYLTPWLRWDRGPFAPDQAVLLDVANRRLDLLMDEAPLSDEGLEECLQALHRAGDNRLLAELQRDYVEGKMSPDDPRREELRRLLAARGGKQRRED